MNIDLIFTKLKTSFCNKRFFLFLVSFCAFFLMLLVSSAIVGEFFTEKVIYVKTPSAYQVYSEKSGQKRNASPIFRDCEYRLPKNTDFWCVSVTDGTRNAKIEVLDSQTDAILANQDDFQEDQYGFSTIKIKCPSISERVRADLQQLSPHNTLIICASIYGMILSIVFTLLLAARERRKNLIGSILLAGLTVFLLNLCLSFSGNPLILSYLTFFAFPFFASVYFWTLRSPGAAMLLFLIALAFLFTRRNEWLNTLDGPVADYRHDFIVSLIAVENDGDILGRPRINIDGSTLELRKFIHFYTGGVQQGRWGLPTNYTKSFLDANTMPLKAKRTVMGLRPYLFWITAQLWMLLGVNWSVFAGFFIFLSFLSIFVLGFSLYLLGGRLCLTLGGLLVVFAGIDIGMLYGNTRNYVVYPASCFIIFTAVVIPKILLKFKQFSCKKALFYLLFVFFGMEISFWCFWRSDGKSLILPAILLPFCIALDHDKKSIKILRIICAIIAMGAGFTTMQWLTQRTVAQYLRDNTGQFHTASCGTEVRAAVTGIEQNDWLYFSDLTQPAYVDNVSPKHYDYGTPQYDFECMKMYFKAIAFSGKDYLQNIPAWGYGVLKCFFVESSEFFKSFFAKICIIALLGCFINSKRIAAQIGFLLSFLWLMAVLFIVLPMHKHFCTIIPWLAVILGLGGRTVIMLPLECTREKLLKSVYTLLGGMLIGALGYVGAWIVSAQTHKIVEAQIRQVEQKDQKFLLPFLRERNAVQLNVSTRPACRRLGIKLHLNELNPKSRLLIAFESTNTAVKSKKFGEAGGRLQCFYPKSSDFFVVVPIICDEKDSNMHLTFFADNVQIDENITTYNADDFTFLPGFSVGLDETGKIVHGEKIGEIAPEKFRSGSWFTAHCQYPGGNLVLPYCKQFDIYDDAVVVK